MVRAEAKTIPQEGAVEGRLARWGAELNAMIRQEGAWWLASFVFHASLMCVLMLLAPGIVADAPPETPRELAAFVPDAPEQQEEPKDPPVKIEPVAEPDPPKHPELDREMDPAAVTGKEFIERTSPDRSDTTAGDEPAARLGVPDSRYDYMFPGSDHAFQASMAGLGGKIGSLEGDGPPPPRHVPGGSPFANRHVLGGKIDGPLPPTSPWLRSIRLALSWLARHQATDGSWSLSDYRHQCRDSSCDGTGDVHADAGATALGLLPFLAADQMHDKKCRYYQTATKAISWLTRNQKPDGDLSAGAAQPMYSHGLATIALCEAFALTKNQALRGPAQAAVRFIEAAQHRQTGGWRYKPGEEGDTSVFAWQVMALESAKRAGLSVDPQVFQRAQVWLKSVRKGSYEGAFSYIPQAQPNEAMTAAGLLCTQYLGARPDEPSLVAGKEFLMKHAPGAGSRNLYAWYYAGQVLHNLGGSDADVWYRKARRVLCDSQATESCAAGSWSPAGDAWGSAGGRVMTTSLATLTLELPYRILPLYNFAGEAGLPALEK